MRREFFGPVFSIGLAMAVLTSPLGAAAQTAGSYTVSGVSVEQSGPSINDARSAAFDQGQRRAFEQLLRNLSVPASQVDPGRVSLDAIADLIAETRVESENTSADVYRATLNFEFRPDAVRRFLQGRDTTFTEVTQEAAVILPVYMSRTGTARLWEGDNPWHDALRRIDTAAERFPMVIPPGDVDDASTIGAGSAMSGDRSAIEEIAGLYDAGGAVVAVAEPGSDGVTIVLNRYVGNDRDVEVIRVSGDPGDPATYEEAAQRMGAFIRDDWPIETTVEAGPENTLLVRVPLQSPDEWFDIQRRLERMSNLNEARVVRMAPTEIILEMTYYGSQDQLDQAAGQEQLRLDRVAREGQPGTAADDVAILRREG